MTVLVSGATSQIGRFLLPRLAAAGLPVRALSRHAQPAQPGVEWQVGDMRALAVPAQPLQAIVSFAPLDAWGDWLATQGVAPAAKIIVTSSMSVLTKQGSAQPDEQALVALLQRGEQNLATQAGRLGMQWTILRPTLVYGAGVDRSLTPIVARARRTRVFPIPMAHGLRQPVHADDIAQAVLAAVQGDAAAGQTLQIGGGERLDYQQMFRRVHASIGTATLPLYLPGMALRLLAATVPRARGPVSRLEQDLVADNTALTALLGVRPRPFAPTPGTWRPG
ncbi:NAD-dependent epimerase/dehydratase family protein [uncultured Stenotrophomonas sp.]|uniref:SDR family oxidoreductase n=1 Tax=uncultured Stenotrophomonas sp. TaxID=165438 RepID=UPI0028EF0BEB|nr:NAD-dependent epimerase/dehydratase family protein [uncultured Stenotrophomonas sp.]